MGARIRQFALKGVKDAVELGVDRVGIGLLVYLSAAVSSPMAMSSSGRCSSGLRRSGPNADIGMKNPTALPARA